MSYALNTTGLNDDQIETARKANIVRFLTDNTSADLVQIRNAISLQAEETLRLVTELETAGTIVRSVAAANGKVNNSADTFAVV